MHNTLTNILKVRVASNPLEPLVKPLKGVAPVSARRAVAQDVDAQMLDEVHLGLVQVLVVAHLRARGASDQASVQDSVHITSQFASLFTNQLEN